MYGQKKKPSKNHQTVQIYDRTFSIYFDFIISETMSTSALTVNEIVYIKFN